MKRLVKTKDGEGQYIYRLSVREGEPDSLLGLPMSLSEYAPNTFTTGQYVGLLGDFFGRGRLVHVLAGSRFTFVLLDRSPTPSSRAAARSTTASRRLLLFFTRFVNRSN